MMLESSYLTNSNLEYLLPSISVNLALIDPEMSMTNVATFSLIFPNKQFKGLAVLKIY